MNEQNSVVKPLTIRKEEYLTNLIDLTNNSNLPFFVVEYILKDFLIEIHNVSKQQLESDKSQYNKLLSSQIESVESKEGN